MDIYSDRIEFDGIELMSDPLNKRVNHNRNVMGIFYEEQPVTWLKNKQTIRNVYDTVSGKVDFFDVGSGSGFFSILAKKHFGGKVLAIDINERAVKFTRENAKLNDVNFEVRLERYCRDSAPERGVKVIFLNPPCHIYPQSIEEKLPLFSSGGPYGQRAFKEQLSIANSHVCEGGMIVFVMECPGRDNKPEFVRYIHDYLDYDFSLFFSNIFTPTKIIEYLEKIYGQRYNNFVNSMAQVYSQVYFTCGYIIRDGKGRIEESPLGIDLLGHNWKDRIQLHQAIVNLSNIE